MKKTKLIIVIASILFLACGQSEEEANKREKQISDSIMANVERYKHEVDSIEKRFNRVKRLMDAGFNQADAERSVDSIANITEGIVKEQIDSIKKSVQK